MKKLLTIIVALAIAFGANAQIGSLVGNAVKKGIQKSVEKKVDEALGGKNKNQETATSSVQDESTAPTAESDDHVPTPEEVMAMVPKIPTFQQLADYLCEQSSDNPRTLKLLANPTTSFLTQMTVALASGYVTMVAGNGHIYALDSQLRHELGITDEQYEAMSPDEQEALARQYAAELEERYMRTAEMLAADEKYTQLLDQYNAIEDQIRTIQNEAEAECRKTWTERHAANNNLCAYYRDAVPVYYKAVLQGMDIRKRQQLAVARLIDERVQTLAKAHPAEVFAGFYNQAGLCATAYVSDAALLTTISDPR